MVTEKRASTLNGYAMVAVLLALQIITAVQFFLAAEIHRRGQAVYAQQHRERLPAQAAPGAANSFRDRLRFQQLPAPPAGGLYGREHRAASRSGRPFFRQRAAEPADRPRVKPRHRCAHFHVFRRGLRGLCAQTGEVTRCHPLLDYIWIYASEEHRAALESLDNPGVRDFEYDWGVNDVNAPASTGR